MADYATLLRDHITLVCRSIDRLFLQPYVPKLQSVGQVCLFLHRQRGFKIPSSAAFGQIGEAYVASIHRWAQAEEIPIRYFAKGDDKEAIAESLLRAAVGVQIIPPGRAEMFRYFPHLDVQLIPPPRGVSRRLEPLATTRAKEWQWDEGVCEWQMS